jgi:hypothetical protein
VNPYVTKGFNNTEVLNGFTSIGVLYLFLAISTGLLPNEDAPGDVIIVIFVINLSIVAGLLFKDIGKKYYKKYQSCKNQKSKEEREK